MITIDRLAAQGDVLFRRITELPAGVVEQPPGIPVVVAHSETGHDHVIADLGVRFFESLGHDPTVCFLSIDGPHADVVHHRAHHTHETLRLTTGLWEVRRQRQWTPQGQESMVED